MLNQAPFGLVKTMKEITVDTEGQYKNQVVITGTFHLII